MHKKLALFVVLAALVALCTAGVTLAGSKPLQAGPTSGQHVNATWYYVSNDSTFWQTQYVKFVVSNGPASPSRSKVNMLVYSGSILQANSGWIYCYRGSPMYWYPSYLLTGKGHTWGAINYYQTDGSYYYDSTYPPMF
jgi:hypothetical protein